MTDLPTPDPRDRRDDGLQDARDDSDPGPSPLAPSIPGEREALQEALNRAHEHVQSLPEDVRQAWREQWSIGHQSYVPEEDYVDDDDRCPGCPACELPSDWRDRYDTREEYEDR